VLFRRSDLDGIADGSRTATFRRWTRTQAVAGRRYRTAVGLIEVESVELVDPDDLTDADARAGGHPDVEALRADLPPGEGPVHRVRFHRVDEPDPRDVLAADDQLDEDAVAAIATRLARLDRRVPWTAATLGAIAERPGVRAGDLAVALGRERLPFKVDVRKLKALGLTRSLPVGYELSPRGAAYLACVGGRDRSDGRGDGGRG
jgi:hypothetical protein